MEEYEIQAQGYKSFWLRCWYGEGGTSGTKGNWHFSLEDPLSGHKRGFPDLIALVSYLESELDREIQKVKTKQETGRSQSQR